MPNYGSLPITGTGTGQGSTALGSGDWIALFNAETLTAPQSSIAISEVPGVGGPTEITFSIAFAAAPTSSLVIQGANTDVDAAYQTLYTSTNKQADNYTDTVAWGYYRAQLVSQSAGGACTVVARAK